MKAEAEAQAEAQAEAEAEVGRVEGGLHLGGLPLDRLPYTSLHLPISRYTSLYLATSACIWADCSSRALRSGHTPALPQNCKVESAGESGAPMADLARGRGRGRVGVRV